MFITLDNNKSFEVTRQLIEELNTGTFVVVSSEPIFIGGVYSAEELRGILTAVLDIIDEFTVEFLIEYYTNILNEEAHRLLEPITEIVLSGSTYNDLGASLYSYLKERDMLTEDIIDDYFDYHKFGREKCCGFIGIGDFFIGKL